MAKIKCPNCGGTWLEKIDEVETFDSGSATTMYLASQNPMMSVLSGKQNQSIYRCGECDNVFTE